MGLYATIRGEEVKFSGLLADVVLRNGIAIVDNTVTIPRDRASAILADFAFSMENGRQLIAEHSIQGQAVYKLVKDAAALAALFDWVVFSEEDAIDFA